MDAYVESAKKMLENDWQQTDVWKQANASRSAPLGHTASCFVTLDGRGRLEVWQGPEQPKAFNNTWSGPKATQTSWGLSATHGEGYVPYLAECFGLGPMMCAKVEVTVIEKAPFV